MAKLKLLTRGEFRKSMIEMTREFVDERFPDYTEEKKEREMVILFTQAGYMTGARTRRVAEV